MVAPIAESIEQMLWANLRKPANHRVPATRLTQRRRSEGRGNEYIQSVKPAPYPAKLCPGCGAQTREGRNCPKCGKEISRKKLIGLAKVGRIVGHSPEARRKQAETQRRHEAAKRAWNPASSPVWLTERAYVEEIQPRLARVTIANIAITLGISEPYAALIQADRYRPHPRHWLALAKLVGTGDVQE